jgi:putative transposase
MIDRDHARLSISKQCELLQVSRAGLYYKPIGTSDLNLELMRLMSTTWNTPTKEQGECMFG